MTSTIFAIMLCTLTGVSGNNHGTPIVEKEVCRIMESGFESRESCEAYRKKSFNFNGNADAFTCMSKSVPVWTKAEPEQSTKWQDRLPK